MKAFPLAMLLMPFLAALCHAETTYQLKENIPYYDEAARQADDYIAERCVLDFYYPENVEGFPTIVWFHGGGLSSGNKYIANRLKGRDIGVIAVNYRLAPKVKAATAIDDAAAAVSWALDHVADYGGDPSLITVSGHSAGGYLTSMIGLDPQYLAKFGKEPSDIASLVPFSGHTITHLAIREERDIPITQPIVDEFAPLYHVSKDAPPMLLITGDREMEMVGRYEENAYFYRMMKVVGHPDIRLFEMDGYGHWMVEPAYPLLIREVKAHAKAKQEAAAN
ncbi:alpha/beta hydrolase [Cerasicoccus maritimus]|uniref:alpha/beta hydrolase n=1 Tax=Cerasicoccus maritimus TaxID=490089 RepID=UPI002852B452|nr:alpha/beta hydrolase [Cerasicoccus maritimus]